MKYVGQKFSYVDNCVHITYIANNYLFLVSLFSTELIYLVWQFVVKLLPSVITETYDI